MKLFDNNSAVKQNNDQMKSFSESLSFSPEFQLLCLCSRVDLDDHCLDEIERCITKELNWNEVIMLARMQGVAPLLSKSLSALEFKGVPSEAKSRLKSMHDAFRVKNLLMATELITILQAFEKQGIRVVPYKGPALAAALYKDISLRQFSDLDLLVKPDDALNARQIVIEMGYQPVEKLRRGFGRLYVQSDCEFTFQHDTQIMLEINWRIAPRYWNWPDIPETVWNDSRRLPMASTSVPWMSPENLLLILCMHGNKHRWDGLKWIVDIAELIREHPELDLARMLESARKQSMERMLTICLLLAHDLLDAAIPENVLSILRNNKQAGKLANKISDKLQSIEKKPPSTLEMLSFLGMASESIRMKSFCYFFLPIYIMRQRLINPV